MDVLVPVTLVVAAGAVVIAVVAVVLLRDRGGLDAQAGVRELSEVRSTVERLRAFVQELERDREAKFGYLAGQLKVAGQQTATLSDTTQRLREALAGSKSRGQWGERMAEDVLRAAGFAEHVNYRKQRATGGGGIPDFTFLLPGEQVCHMDVKFPLDNYVRFVEAESPLERQRHLRQFQRDVRQRVKELADRNYDAAENSVDVVLLFVPNERVYAAMHEHDPALLDEALSRRIVLCSPFTLFAVLAVLRQAADSFRLEQRSREIVALLGGFAAQWTAFTEQMDRVGRRIEGLQKDYDAMAGVRRRQLERQLDRVEDVRRRERLPAVEVLSGSVSADDEIELDA
jgi:DNA recombination protein RmuC